MKCAHHSHNYNDIVCDNNDLNFVCPGYAAQYERPVLFSFGIVLLIVFVSLFIVNRNEIIHGYKVRSLSKTIPHTSENFVGREDEIQELLARVNFEFTEMRIINIVGSPGFGKSTLAIQLGHRLIDQGVYVHYVNMEDLLSGGSIELVLAEKILKSSDITAKTVTFDRLLQWARDRSGYTLLILDNCDNVLHVLLSKYKFILAVRSLVQTSTQIKVIMTSRETVVHTEHYSWYKVYQLSPKAAISLLDMKLPKLKVSLKEKEEISELTGNVPLALHIVGSLLMLEDPPSPDAVIEELKLSPVQFLSPKKLPIELRIDASISLSYRYLDDDLKEVAFFLALFSGSFGKDAPIEISKDIKLLTNSTAKTLSVTQIELRALVDRSLLEYNERGGRYQYHRLIREFLLGIVIELSDSDFEAKQIIAVNFYNGFRNFFLKKLHLNTVDFKLRYVDSLKFLDIEKHNIYILFNSLSNPALVSRHSLLMTINYVTLAIDAGYLTCRFTNSELRNFLIKVVSYLDSKILKFQDRCGLKTITDLSETTWTQREYYQRIYIQLLITYSDLLAKIISEEYAVQFIERRKSTVDLLSDEKSPPQFQSSSQQYESHKPANSDNSPKPTKFRSSSSQQYESHKQHYVHAADNSGKLPTKFQSSSQSDRVHAPGSVPLSTKAQRQKFYTNLGNHYLALGQHSKVAECQLKIIEGVNQCQRENCSYREIGYMYYNIENYVEAAKFFELSLENDVNNLMSEADILLELLAIYKGLGKWLWSSKEEVDTLSRMTSVCHKFMKKDDKLIFYNWKMIIKLITAMNENVDFLEERLFSIVSTPNTEFQLKPKDALEIVKVVEQTNNYTKTLLWGSLLLQPFENYNNFSVEEKVNVLRIYLSTSKAKIKSWHFSEGLNGMEHVYTTIEQSLELQNHHGTYEMNSTACFYLIIRLKYVIPCYRDYLNDNIAAFSMSIFTSIVSFPMNLVYIVFVVPFEFSKIEASNNGAEVKVREPRRPSTAVTPTGSKTFKVQIVEDIVFTVVTDLKYMVRSIWYSISSWHLYQIADIFFRFSINVITVAIRLWILCGFFVNLVSVCLVLCTLFLEAILAPMYMSVVLSPTLPQAAREVFIALCDFLIFSSKVQVQLLQNRVGFFLLYYYIHFSQLNLAQLYPFDYKQNIDAYDNNYGVFIVASFLVFLSSLLGVIIPFTILFLILKLCYTLLKRKFVYIIVFFVLVILFFIYLLL